MFYKYPSFTVFEQMLDFSLPYVMHFYYKFIATKSPQACNQGSFYCFLKVFGSSSMEGFSTIWTQFLLSLSSIKNFE